MANIAYPRSALSELGGKHLHDRKLIYDAPSGVHYSDRRSHSDDSAPKNAHNTQGRGSGQTADEEGANEDDEEDSSVDQEEEQEDDEDEPEVTAPSRGHGKGKGKGKGIRPATRLAPADDEESHAGDKTPSREAGHLTGNPPLNHLLNDNKKRTFSSLSSTSLLFGDVDDAYTGTFPRPKLARTLSHSGGSGLLAYKSSDQEAANGSENAIESSDDEGASGKAGTTEATDEDEDYSGVNLISDDESDVEKMEEQEESFIIQDSKQHTTDLFSQDLGARRHSLDSHASESIFDFDPSLAGAYYAPINMQDFGFSQFFEPEPARQASPDPISKRKFSDSSTKRVRFDDEVEMSDSSSSSSELDSALFPDLFLEQDKVPPSLYQLMEVDKDSDEEDYSSSASEHSYWDVGQDETRHLARAQSHDFDDESSGPGSSGYETDMGDTTDEESDAASDAPLQTPKRKSVLHRPSSAPASRVNSPRPFIRSGNAIGPTRGIFIHEDSRKAIAITNRTTKGLTFYRPKVPAHQPYGAYSSTTSTANNSPRTSVHQLNASDSEFGNEMFSNAFMNSTDIMLTGIFGSAPADAYLFGGESIGPPEAFYPFISIGNNGNVMSEDDEYEDDDYEDDLNIADFMDFGSDVEATDLEQDYDTEVPATPATSMVAMNGSTPAQPTPTPANRRRNQSDAMLEHFDRAGVTAFRNNQNRYRDIACLPHDPDLRASVSRPIRSGRSAETLMSPLRKRSSTTKRPARSPFAGVTKATGRLQSSVKNGQRPPRLGTFS